MSDKEGLILYTDGGYGDGHGGYGIHGYFYEVPDTEIKNLRKVNAPTTTGYFDKTTIVEENKTPVKINKYIDLWAGLGTESTNNTAELSAAIEGIKVAKEHNVKNLTILTDSEYVLGSVAKYLDVWKTNGWKRTNGESVSNIPLWQELDLHKNQHTENGGSITWKWTKGHSGILGNEYADVSARNGWVSSSNGNPTMVVKYKSPVGYRAGKHIYNRLFAQSELYFIQNASTPIQKIETDQLNHYVYWTGSDNNNPVMRMKKSTDHSMAVLFLKEENAIITKLINEHNKRSIRKENMPASIKLNNVFSQNMLETLTEDDVSCLRTSVQNNGLMSPFKLPLTSETRPPLLAWRVESYMMHLQTMLLEYIAKTPSSSGVHYTDVTHLFYTTEEKKGKTIHKLTPFMKNGDTVVKVPVKYSVTDDVISDTEVVLTTRLDIPDKNTMASLADKSPKVTIITVRESSVCFRYYTVIETRDDYVIWTSYHANLKVIK